MNILRIFKNAEISVPKMDSELSYTEVVHFRQEFIKGWYYKHVALCGVTLIVPFAHHKFDSRGHTSQILVNFVKFLKM